MGWLPSLLHSTVLCLLTHHFLLEFKQDQKTVLRAGRQKPWNSVTSQTWLLSSGDCDIMPALPGRAAPGGPQA